MNTQHRNTTNNNYTEFSNPLNSNQKTFLGKKLRVSEEAQKVIRNLSGPNKIKLNNNLNQIVTDVVNHSLYSDKVIYLELASSYLKIQVENTQSPYIGTITQAKVIEKPKPLSSISNETKSLEDCKIQITRGLSSEIAKTGYQFEKVLVPNVFTARELVNIQTLRMREHVKNWQLAGHTNRQWADVCYGAKPGIFNNGSGDEIIALSAIFGISEQTNIMSKTYFSSMRQTDIKKILHRYAVIFGHPFYERSGGTLDNIQNQLEEGAPDRNNTIRKYANQAFKYNTDVVIHVDSDLNIHKFFRNGHYRFINCSSL